jgi:CRISPR/Cas system CMR subunit Cmr4 (Cas7 group RAMP superfamily)
MRIDYKIRFKSDFHIGSGGGIPGVVDNALKFDADGIPEISGKTVKGLLKDAIKSLIYICNDPNGNEVMELIFGKEGKDETCFRFNTPNIESVERNRIRQNPHFHYRISSVKTRNAIDRRRLVAKEKALFSTEIAPPFLEYSGSIVKIKEFNPSLKDDILFYIIAGLRFITHLGGNRRRGCGLLRFEITGVYDVSGEIKWENVIEKKLRDNLQ